MGLLDFSSYDADTQSKVLAWLNYASAWPLDNSTQDVPGQTTGRHRRGDYDIGPTVARRIVRERVQRGGVFRSVEDLNATTVRGFDLDKLQDVAYTAGYLDMAKLGMAAPMPVPGNQAEVFVDGPRCLAMILAEIAKAQHYIHLQMMLFFSDGVGCEIAKALARKAQEGVSVRVMADGDVTASGYLGSLGADSSGDADFSKVSRLIEEAGGKVIDTREESYWEWEWGDKRDSLRDAGVPEEFLAIQDLVQDDVQANWNVTDHRKFIVIDGVTSIVGSLNIGRNYLYTNPLTQNGLPADRKQWHDGCLRLRGPISSALNKHFASTWMVRGGDVFDFTEHHRSQQVYGTDLCTPFVSFPGNPTNPIRDYFINLVRYAEGPITIENPYIIDQTFWKTLATLDEEQGGKISLINSISGEVNDHPSSETSIKCNMWGPFKRGVSLYDYARGYLRMSHWKIAVDAATSTVMHGSYNLNYRSALHDFELCVLVQSATLAAKVGEILQADKNISTRISDIEEFYEQPGEVTECLLLEVIDWFV
jgi:cardiolipin synthase A/B